MSIEGMVDALEEAHRVVAEGGTVIDVRPDNRPYDDDRSRARFSFVEAAEHPVGRYISRPGFIASCQAADAAVRDVVDRGLFTRCTEDAFVMRTSFRSLEAVAAYHERGLEVLEPTARRRIEELLARHPQGRVVREERAMVNVLRR